MCLGLFSEEAPCGLTLVSNHLLQATTKSLHFGWLLQKVQLYQDIERLRL